MVPLGRKEVGIPRVIFTLFSASGLSAIAPVGTAIVSGRLLIGHARQDSAQSPIECQRRCIGPACDQRNKNHALICSELCLGGNDLHVKILQDGTKGLVC